MNVVIDASMKRINAYLPVENNEQKNTVAKLRTKNKTIRGEDILVFKDKWVQSSIIPGIVLALWRKQNKELGGKRRAED